MTSYQGFLAGFLITGSIGFASSVWILVRERVEQVLEAGDLWIKFYCWGMAIIWPTALALLIMEYYYDR